MFSEKEIVVGITGGIAAYKSAELVSSLKKAGANVHCIMTKSALEFIQPLTLRTLSQNPVYYEMFDEPKMWNVEHIALADRADLVLIVPATANIIGKIAGGISDDMLSTTVMATKAPVLIAPAMNVNMYENPITQENINKLQKIGYYFVGPIYGKLACGYQGTGKLADINEIIQQAEILVCKDRILTGHRVLITAGPTQEALDPVRYLSNKSTGKMGYALAKQAKLLGANVTLISGPTNLTPFCGIDLIKVTNAREMYEKVIDCYEKNDIIIKAAAVSDYRPVNRSTDKIKKQEGNLLLELERNPDILAGLGEKKGTRVLVGFAAETKEVLKYAAHKVQRKNLDFIVANDVTQSGAGFAHDTNIVTLVFPNGDMKELPELTKNQVALEILNEVYKIIRAKKE